MDSSATLTRVTLPLQPSISSGQPIPDTSVISRLELGQSIVELVRSNPVVPMHQIMTYVSMRLLSRLR